MLIEDEVLVKFLAEVIKENQEFKENLMTVVMRSRNLSEGENVVIGAANAISVLVAANVSFSNKNLSNVRIPGAVLRDRQFCCANFTEADLSGAILGNCKLDGALFDRTKMKYIKLGILPDINVACCFKLLLQF